MTPTTLTAIIREDDLEQYIENSREFWITRNGRPMKRCWSELTAAERRQTIEAEQRAAYVVEFGIY